MEYNTKATPNTQPGTENGSGNKPMLMPGNKAMEANITPQIAPDAPTEL